MKKSWHKPQLVVIARGEPQEAVLVSCKTGNPLIGAPNTVGNACICPPGGASCQTCETLSDS